MSLPSLNAIRAFEAAARLQSFKDAADELKLSPSAVSRHIHTLEHALGLELFERNFRQVHLTEKAVHYSRRLSEAFKIIQESTEEIGAYGPSRRRKLKRVTLSINATFMNLWLADRLPRFRRAHPECELEVSIHDDNAKGGNPRADVRILFTSDVIEDPSLTPLVSLIVIPVCAPALAKGHKALRRLTDLAKHRLLHENTTAWWEEWINGVGVTGVDPKAGAIFHDPSLVIREAVNGGGVALADNIQAEDLLARGLLVAPFPIRRRFPGCYCLAQRPGAPALAGVKQFRQWLLLEIERHKTAMNLT
jgi:LysR family transcriptional regulator, glycine cleavage system transcriptional activator